MAWCVLSSISPVWVTITMLMCADIDSPLITSPITYWVDRSVKVRHNHLTSSSLLTVFVEWASVGVVMSIYNMCSHVNCTSPGRMSSNRKGKGVTRKSKELGIARLILMYGKRALSASNIPYKSNIKEIRISACTLLNPIWAIKSGVLCVAYHNLLYIFNTKILSFTC